MALGVSSPRKASVIPGGASVRTAAGTPVRWSTGRQKGKSTTAATTTSPATTVFTGPDPTAIGRSLARTIVPLSAATATNGHHATPRWASAPIAANTPIQSNVGQGTRRPPRAIRATTAATDAKNRNPLGSRREVGCHSVVRAVTPLFEVRPIAYVHTPGPNGVRQAATTDTAPTASVCRTPGSRSWRSSRNANPRITGARTKLPWRLAQATTTSGPSQSADGRSRRITTRSRATAKQAIPKSCGRRAIAGAAMTNAMSVITAAVRSSRPRRRATVSVAPTMTAVSTARSRTRPVQPAARYTIASRTCAPHCWSTHGRPAAVNVQVSIAGIWRASRISPPARNW